MRLYTVRGGTKEELETHKYNIGIGISLGNKWFSVDNTLEATRWALQYTREQVVIYVADTIHAINLEVRNRNPHERALRRVKERGQEIVKELGAKAHQTFEQFDLERIVFATWDDIEDSQYKKKVKYLYDLYNSNQAFKESILEIVRGWISKEKRHFSEEEITKLGTYMLEELPEVMCRVPMKSVVYDAYAYPADGDFPRFVERLQKGELFPEIKENILDTEPKVFLEVR